MTGLRIKGFIKFPIVCLDVNIQISDGKMIKYEVIIYWSEEDKSFIAEVPELPGCAADEKRMQ